MTSLFSNRLPPHDDINPLLTLLDAEKKNPHFIDLTESNPTKVGLTYPAQAILSAYQNPTILTYEPCAQGLPIAREAVSRYYQERHIAISPQNIFLTASTSESYHYLFKLLADPGDAILVPEPSYPLFDTLLGLENIRKQAYHLREHNGQWRIDADHLRAVAAGAKAIVVVNPNNPTGSYVHPDDWPLLIDVCHEHTLALICDEVFWDYDLAPTLKQSSAAVTDVLTFTLNGLSKLCGLPQLKLGWIAVTGPQLEVAQAKAHLEFIADCFLSVGTPVQLALPELLQLNLHKMITERVRANLEILRNYDFQIPLAPFSKGGNQDSFFTKKRDQDPPLGKGGRGDFALPQGGWSVAIPLPAPLSDDTFCELLLTEHHLWVYPGYFFDFLEGEWIVISLLPENRKFTTAIEKLTPFWIKYF